VVFRDREQAGRLLADALEWYRPNRPMILGLARGGVPIALEVVRALGGDLDLIVARKIGAPGQPEYAIGAIAEGGAVYVRREALPELGLAEEDAAAMVERESVELARRVRMYRGGRAMPPLSGRTVIVVDDGVATGATARAAARSARLRGASRVILAAPVIAAASLPELKLDFDDVVAVHYPSPFFAVGRWYERFEQVPDESVLGCLRQGLHPEQVTVRIPFDGTRAPGALEGNLAIPSETKGLVMFVHGGGSARSSPRSLLVAGEMQPGSRRCCSTSSRRRRPPRTRPPEGSGPTCPCSRPGSRRRLAGRPGSHGPRSCGSDTSARAPAQRRRSPRRPRIPASWRRSCLAAGGPTW
jgi:putative phosphoribosyl transferase